MKAQVGYRLRVMKLIALIDLGLAALVALVGLGLIVLGLCGGLAISAAERADNPAAGTG